MEDKLALWRNLWSQGDFQFVVELFELVEIQEKEIRRLAEVEKQFNDLNKELEGNRILLENKRVHDQMDLVEMRKERIITTDEYWTRFQEDEAFERFMAMMEKRPPR